MRLKLTFILAFFNIAAFYYIYKLETEAPELSALAGRPVISQDVTTLDKITVEIATNELQETRVLVKDRDKWYIKSPIAWPANENAIQHILSELQLLKREISFSIADIEARGQTLENYGLNEPDIVLSLSSNGGTETKIKIGAPTQMGSRLYILHPDQDEILVVNHSLLQTLSLTLDDLRRKNPINIPVFEAQFISLQSNDQRVRIEKDSNEWNFVAPIAATADNSKVENRLSQLYALPAVTVVEESEAAPTTTGLANPILRVTIGGNNRTQTLLLGNPVEAQTQAEEEAILHYAQLEDNPTVFTVPAKALLSLTKAQETLRERKLFSFAPENISSLEINQFGRSLTLQKLEEQADSQTASWQVIGKEEDLIQSQKADNLIVEALLKNLLAVEAMRFVSDAPSETDLITFGLETPNATVTLYGDENHTLLLGETTPTNPSNIYAKLLETETVYEVRSRILAQSSANPLHYLNRTLSKLANSARIQSLKVVSLPDEEVLYEKNIDINSETWLTALESEENSELKKATISLLEHLKVFKVKNIIAAEFTEIADLPYEYRIDAEIVYSGTQEEQKETRHYFFTKRSGGTSQLGASKTPGMTFQLTQSMIDSIFPLTFKMDAPEFITTPEEVIEANPIVPTPETSTEVLPAETP